MKKNLLISLISAALLLSACGAEKPEKFDTNSSTQKRNIGGYTIFDSANANIPYPNNILFAGSSDGKLRIPYNVEDADASVKAALTSLDGFSTQAPITVSLTQAMDSATLKDGVHIYEATAIATPQTLGIPTITSIKKELTYGVDFAATMVGTKLVILPMQPLASHTNYVVALTNEIKDNQGNELVPDTVTLLLNSQNSLLNSEGKSASATLSDADAQKLEGLRTINQAMYQKVIAQGISRDALVMTWSFQTQTIGAVTHALMVEAQKSTPTITLEDFNATLNGVIANRGINATIRTGNLENIPYYLGVGAEAIGLNSAFFELNQTTQNLPAKRSDVSIPILVALPTNENCNEPYPVIIFQHGVTVDRTAMLPIATAVTKSCHAVVAIDLPLHGIDDSNPLAPYLKRTNERHFNLPDLNGDGVINSDDALLRYVNLASLRTTRDNMRQSASDFVALTQALKKSSLFNGDDIGFIGHSLGTISAIPFLSEANLTSVTLAMPGAGIAELFSASKRYGPVVRGLLQQSAGIAPDSADYSAFLLATQTVIDDADPINYAMKAGEKQRGKTLTFKVSGDATHPSDIVIPNSVASAPLAGTDPFLRLYSADANKSINLLAAEHSSILTPAPQNNDNSGISATDLNSSFYQIQSILGNFIATTTVGDLNATLAKDSSK